jgi:diguanylate cyclase (GGDEF)-like protein
VDGPDTTDSPRASAANAMQMRLRSQRTHRLLGPFLAGSLLLAAWVVWLVGSGVEQPGRLFWPQALVFAVVLYLAVLWSGRKAYQSGVQSPWVKAIHGAPLFAAGLFGLGAAATAGAASIDDLRLLALTALVLCGTAFPALAALDTVFRIFVALVMLPLVAASLSHTPSDVALNVVLVASTVVLLIGHAGLARTLRNAFRADVEQRALLHRLQQANQALSADRMVLQTESRTDPLTGLANRRYLERALGAEWNRCRRSEAPLSCVMLDIDHFKDFNDHYGHDGGDRALKAVAEVLNNSSRRAGDVVARYGGEEFVLLLPETGSDGAAIVAELLRQAINSKAIEHKASPLTGILSASLGVATLLPDSDRMPDELFKAADLALYEAKRLGRNRVVLADESTLEAARLAARGMIG